MTAAHQYTGGIHDDVEWASWVRRHSTLYRSGRHGAAVAERIDRLVTTSMRLASSWASVRDAWMRHLRGDTESTARELGAAAARAVLRAHEHDDALGHELTRIRVPSCSECTHPLTHDVVDGWHCEQMGCGEGQRWLSEQSGVYRRRGGGL